MLFDFYSHWTVGNEKFYSKPMAVEYASRTGQQIHFNFFNHVYDKVDWTKEPKQSLQELYKLRAEQLLSKYDYVVLLLSGGSDSTSIVRTFLNNGYKPNEIVSYGVVNNFIDKNSITNLEITLSASKTASLCLDAGIPYRFINLWDNIKDVNYNDKWFETADSRMSIDNLLKIEGLHNDKKFLDIARKGKKVCLVNGLEKPRVFIHDGYFTTAFLDGPLTGNYWAKDVIDNRGIYTERFFTTVDMPEINVKQCHVIIEHFENNIPNYKEKLIHSNKFQVDEYYNILNDILYPGTWETENYFTLGKTGSYLKYIFFQHVMKDLDLVKNYKGLMKDFYRSIDRIKYVVPNGDLSGFYGNFYKIKKVKD